MEGCYVTRMRCGMCGFELPPNSCPIKLADGARLVDVWNPREVVIAQRMPTSRPYDTEIHEKEVTHRKPGWRMDINSFANSAERGCLSCLSIHKVLDAYRRQAPQVRQELSRITYSAINILHWSHLEDGLHKSQAEFEFFHEKGVEGPASIGARNLLPGNTESESTLNRLRNWLDDCVSNHSKCGHAVTAHRPTRLLHIHSLEPTPYISLVDDCSNVENYVCLSHCWGSKLPVCLTQSNLLEFKTEIPWELLPNLFRDALKLTVKLGFQYIWIDSLCIMQDNVKDWHREAASMSTIYQNARLTISASKSRDSCDSLFSQASSLHTSNEVTKVNDCTIYLRKYLDHPSWPSSHIQNKKADLPLLARAWVYQERLISPRTIHYTANELVWECREELLCECSTCGTDKIFPMPKVSHQDLFMAPSVEVSEVMRRWNFIVHEYSGLDLSFAEDRLPAISGIARQMHGSFKHLLGNYVAGMWTQTILNTISWQLSLAPLARPHPKFAPTWSWASVDGCVYINSFEYADWVDEKICKHMEFLDFSVEPAGPDDFGMLKSAKVRVRGSFFAGTLEYKRYDILDKTVCKVITKSIRENFLPDYAFFDPGPDHIEKGTAVYCLRIGLQEVDCDHYAVKDLVLRCVSEEDELYERIGIVHVTHVHISGSWFSATDALAEQKVITLI